MRWYIDYERVRHNRVWATAQTSLPLRLDQVEALLNDPTGDA